MNRIHLVTAGLCLSIAGLLLAGRQTLSQSFGPSGNSGPYLTHIATDKPIYRSGERLYVRAVMLQAVGHMPGAAGIANFEIKGPKGNTVTSGFATVTDSVAGFSWTIPSDQAGGEYTIRVNSGNGDPPAERKFDIRAY